MSKRTLTIIISIVLALSAGIGTLSYLNANKPPPEAAATPPPVLKQFVVAMRDVPAHLLEASV